MAPRKGSRADDGMPGAADDEREGDAREEETAEEGPTSTASPHGKGKGKRPAKAPKTPREKKPRRQAETPEGEDGAAVEPKKKVFHFKIFDDNALLREAIARSYFLPGENETKEGIAEAIADVLNRTLFRDGDGYERLKGRAVYLRLRQLLHAAKEQALHELRASGTSLQEIMPCGRAAPCTNQYTPYGRHRGGGKRPQAAA